MSERTSSERGAPEVDMAAALAASGLAPPGGEARLAATLREGGDSARLLSDLWLAQPGRRERARWWARAAAAGSRLTWGGRLACVPSLGDWLAGRLIWWPDGAPHGRWIAPVSSRLGRAPEQRPAWFAALRAVCFEPRAGAPTWLAAAEGAAAAPAVREAARRFGRRLVWIAAPWDSADRWAVWGRRVRGEPPEGETAVRRAFVSPPLVGAAAPGPARDVALAALADLLVVLMARPGGVTERLALTRLTRPGWPVRLALGPRLTDPNRAAALLSAGAAAWRLPLGPRLRPPPGGRPSAAPAAAAVSGRRRAYLTHCTRRRSGPWPGQTESAYWSDLLLDRPDADHSPLASLQRIVRERRIAASGEGVRGGWPVVCFTAAPLDELPAMRRFRPHRGRWDFEPYGICICRDALWRRGARPVLYGDERLWGRLPEAERWRFQRRATRGGGVDWRVEREWRCLGDVDLRSLGGDEAFCFVPEAEAASRLAPLSPWPVVVLAD